MDDDRTNVFGLSPQRPGRATAVAQYLTRSMTKLHIAEYHLVEFEREEDRLTGEDFFDFEREPFLPVQAHADGALIQLAAAFDAFACAVSHRYEFPDAEKAYFGTTRWNERLVAAADGGLSDAIRDIAAEDGYRGLLLYRNLAAHRGVIGELQRGSDAGEGKHEVRVLLPAWLPKEYPDYPEAEVRPILRRILAWARPRIDRLQQEAALAWDSGEREEEEVAVSELDSTLEPEIDETSNLSIPTEEERAPWFGEWRVWFANSSHNFDTGVTVPDAWRVRRKGAKESHVISAWGLDVDGLRDWLANTAGPKVAKEALYMYRPRQVKTNQGPSLMPSSST